MSTCLSMNNISADSLYIFEVPEQSPEMTFEESNISYDRKNLLKGYNMLLYFSGSMIMYKPAEDCIIDFLSGGILKKLPVSSSNPRFIKAASLLRESCTDKDSCKETLKQDYDQLFSTGGLQLAIPHESAYPLSSYINGPARRVSDFYDSYGWNSRPFEKYQDDHLGVELLFLTKLIDKYIQMDDEPCCCEMTKEIHRFIGHHILSWLPEWNGKIQDNSRTLCYKGIGNLIHACMEDLYGIFDFQNKPL